MGHGDSGDCNYLVRRARPCGKTLPLPDAAWPEAQLRQQTPNGPGHASARGSFWIRAGPSFGYDAPRGVHRRTRRSDGSIVGAVLFALLSIVIGDDERRRDL
jgi:hypothetical protein